MKRVLAACTVLALHGVCSLAIAAEGETPVVKGNIEIYGAAKMSVDMISTDNRTTGVDKRLTKVSSNSSRLGFKGTEELGGGLSGIMQLELGINSDGSQTAAVGSITSATTNTTTGVTTVKTKSTNIDRITYRNSFAGLSHKAAGTVLFGIHDTPYKLATGSLDAFGDSMADYNAIIGSVNAGTDFDLRAKDTVMYQSPRIFGFQVAAGTSATGLEADNGATSANPILYSASAAYTGGPAYVSLAYETHRSGYATFDKAGFTAKGMKTGVGLSLGGTKLGVVYEILKNDQEKSAFERNAYYVSLRQQLAKETVKIAYGKAGDGDDPTTVTGAKMIAAGFEHAFSKRTTAYVLYARTKNDSDAKYGVGQGGAGGAYAPVSGGEDPSVTSLGVSHSF